MRTISVAVVEADYEAFRQASQEQGRSIADLIREAMAHYRATELEARTVLEDVPVLAGHALVGCLPTRGEIYDEAFSEGA